MLNNSIEIMGVRIDRLSAENKVEKIKELLTTVGQKMIFTPNPEMLVDAQKDEDFQKILNSAKLNICDGKGIQLVMKEKIERIPGADFVLDICNVAAEMGKKIYLLGSGDDVTVKKTVEKLIALYPKLQIVGADKGPKIKVIKTNGIKKIEVDREANARIVRHIFQTKPDVLFVAFGHIKQEKWINYHLPKLPSVKIAMGVGGSFDYLSNKVKRAPQWMRQIGLEWLYRLITQPKRFGRIFKATILFLYYYVKTR